MFGTFSDIAIDPAANRAARLFIRKKIAEIVKPSTSINVRRPSAIEIILT